MSLGSKKRDALLELEIWDYLRDGLLLVLTRHYFCDEEQIALVVAPSVCLAMTCLCRVAGSQASGDLSGCLVAAALIFCDSRIVYDALSMDGGIVQAP